MHAAIGLTMGMYLFALVMIDAESGRVRRRYSGSFHQGSRWQHAARPRSFFRSSNSPRNASGRWGLPRRLVSPEPYAKAEAPTKAR